MTEDEEIDKNRKTAVFNYTKRVRPKNAALKIIQEIAKIYEYQDPTNALMNS